MTLLGAAESPNPQEAEGVWRKETHTGASVRRREDARLLRGTGNYTDDRKLAGTLEAAFLRSDTAHATIRSIDSRRAEELDGVVAVYTHEGLDVLDVDVPGLPHPDAVDERTQPMLARDEVAFVGQPIAMVIAESRYIAEDALALVEVDYEVLPVAVDLAAAAEGLVRVHTKQSDNVACEFRQVVGDPSAAFEAAEIRLSADFVVERSAATPIEPRAVLASFEPRSQVLTVWGTFQLPHPRKLHLAAILGLSASQVEVVVEDIGGGFGTKGVSYSEEFLVPWAAMRLGVPVAWTEDRSEHFVGSTHERRQVHSAEIAATRDGTVTGLRCVFLHDSGAYLTYGNVVARLTGAHLAGPYRIPNLEIESKSIYTNLAPVTPYRGAGRPHACFVVERLLDKLAAELELDPIDIRRLNLVGRDEFPYSRPGLEPEVGVTTMLDSGNYQLLLDRAVEAADYGGFRERQTTARESGRCLGIGLACYVEATSCGPWEGGRVQIDPTSGKVLVATGSAPQGQAHETVFAQIAADYLGAPLDAIDVVCGDTRTIEWGFGTGASRGMIMSGSAIRQAAIEVRDQLLSTVAEMLEVSREDLEISEGVVFVRGSKGTGVTLREAAEAAQALAHGFSDSVEPEIAEVDVGGPPMVGPGLSATSYYASRQMPMTSGVTVVILEVDVETGELRYERVIAAHDCGTVVNPAIVDGQIMGGVAQGIAGTAFERMAYGDDGQLRNASLVDFLMPYATEVPEITTTHIETPSPLNALGVKGAGESGVIAVAPATAAAIEDALSPLNINLSNSQFDPAGLYQLIQQARADRG